MTAACSISSRWRCGCSSGAADDEPGDSSANGSSRDDSGASEAGCRDSDGAATGTGTGAGIFVGGRCCGAAPSSDDGAAGTEAQEGAGNGEPFPSNPGRGSSAPACPAPRSCATAWLATATTGVFAAAASPEHCSARGARPGTDWGAALPVAARTCSRPAGCTPVGAERPLNATGSPTGTAPLARVRLLPWHSPFALRPPGHRHPAAACPKTARSPSPHPLRPAVPAAEAAEAARYGHRDRHPVLVRGSDPGRRSGAPSGSGARRRQRRFPTAPPKSGSALRSAAWPAPIRGAGTAASPGCAAARRRRCSPTPAPRSRTGSRTRAAAPDRGDLSRRDGRGCALRGCADWRPGAWPDRGVADRPARRTVVCKSRLSRCKYNTG